MKFELIEYNYNKQLRLIILLLIYLNIIIIGLFVKIFHFEYSFLKWSLIFFLGAWAIHYWFINTFNVLGMCVFKSEEILIIKNGQKLVLKHSETKKIYFYNGGYEGEMREYEIFYTGSWSRNGTKNFIEINENRYQLLVKSKSDLEFMKNYLNDMKKKNINTKFINKY